MSPVESLKTQNKFKKTEIGEIPVDWPITKISELCEVNPYYQIPKGIKCAYIEMAAVTANRPDILYFKERIAGETGGTRFKNGDTLFARITPCTENGKIAFVNNMPTEFGLGSTEFIVLSPKIEKIDPLFLFYNVKQDRVRQYSVGRMVGTTGRQRVPSSVFETELRIPAPPLSEQKKIAEILTAVDAAIEKIDAVIGKTKQLKKGLLHKLLTRKAGNDHPALHMESLLLEFRNGYAFPSDGYVEEGIPIITMANISLEGRFQFSYRECNKWPYEQLGSLKQFVLNKGDLIISMTDVTPTKNLIGRMTVIDIDGPYLLNQRVGRLTVRPEKADKNYLAHYSNSDDWRKFCMSHSALGAQANLSTADIKKANVPLPSIDRQKKIAEILCRWYTVGFKILYD